MQPGQPQGPLGPIKKMDSVQQTKKARPSASQPRRSSIKTPADEKKTVSVAFENDEGR